MGIAWNHFAPTGGGSFGREDMGEFCNVDGRLFVVSYMELSVSHLNKTEVESLIIELIEQDKSELDTFEYSNGEMTSDITANWREIIGKSSLTQSNW